MNLETLSTERIFETAIAFQNLLHLIRTFLLLCFHEVMH